MPRIFPLLAVVLSLALGGCLSDSPPSPPSQSVNTWLLGVWEAKSAEGNLRRATVAPSSSDRMTVLYEEINPKKQVVRSGTFPAWISHVGSAKLLVVEVPSPEKKNGKGYLLLGYQLLDPLNVRVRELVTDISESSAPPFALRKTIREHFKKGTLFSGNHEIWQKTGEVFSPKKDADPAQDTFVPTRNLPRPTPTPKPQKINLEETL